MDQTYPFSSAQRQILMALQKEQATAQQAYTSAIALILAGHDVTDGDVVNVTDAGIVVRTPDLDAS